MPLDPLTQAQTRSGRRNRWRRAAQLFLHDHRTEYVLFILIIFSVLLVPAEQLVTSDTTRKGVVQASNILTGIFIFELVLRFWTVQKKHKFLVRYWIDILAVLPLVRPLRMLRVLRVFRAGVLFNRRSSNLGGSLFSGSTSSVTSLAAASLALVLVTAQVLHELSRRNGHTVSFEDLLWASVFTLVGGEPIGLDPQFRADRTITLVLMIGGLTVFGVFVGGVSAGMVSRLTKGMELYEMDLDELVDHVLILGWNGSGRTVVRELLGPGTPPDRSVVVVTESTCPPDMPRDVRQHHLYHHQGDYTRVDVLKQVGVSEASQVVLLTDGTIPRSNQDRDARTVLAALTIERLAPHIYTGAELNSRESEPLLKMAGVEEIVIGDWYAGVILGSASRNRRLVSVLDEILTLGGNAFYSVELQARHHGMTVRKLHQVFVEEHGALLVSIDKHQDVPRVPMVNPDPDLTVAKGDIAMVLARVPPSS